MNLFRGISLSAIAVCSLLATSSSFAVTYTPLPAYTDTDFRDFLALPEVTEPWAAEVRGGNNTLHASERELGINGPTGLPVDSGQFIFGDGVGYNFSLVKTGTTLTFDFAGTVLTYSAADNVNQFLIRARSNNDGSAVTLSNIVVDSVAYAGSVVASDGNTIEYLQIDDFSDDFTLTGTAAFDYNTNGELPSKSRIAFQIKGMTIVPTPATLGAGLIMMGGMVARRRR